MEDLMAQAQAVFAKHWGYDKFRPAQASVIEAVLAGDDVLAVLATGYGKSVCFQIPAIMCEGTTLVVSPLIALMKDQVDAAQRNGIAASYVNSHVEPDDATERLGKMKAGDYDLFYVAPERMRSRAFRDALAATDINLIAIDEAHCASMWGHDFRPAYQRLHEISSMLFQVHGRRPPILAVTATATHDIEDDVAAALGMEDEYVRVVGDPVRPNLHYQIETPWGSEWGCTMSHARQRFHIAGRHLVYVGTRNGTTKLVEMLAEHFPKDDVAAYHGGMSKDERTDVQDRFLAGSVRVVCATNAFGMGIDVPDIRTVLHMGVPGSLEAYVQETGRAGRDGKDSRVILVESDYAVQMQQLFIDRGNPPMPLYGLVWAWLVSALEPGQTIRMSGADIAKEVSVQSGKVIEGAQVGTILNVMEAHSLIEREYYDGGCPVELDLEDAIADLKVRGMKKAIGKVLSELIDRAKVQLGTDEGVCILNIQKEDIALDAGVSRGTVTSALRELDADSVLDVGKVFTGKTTKLKRHVDDLEEVLPIEQLEAKRERDLARFGSMMSYTKTANPKQFIRDYFKGHLDRTSGRRPASE